MKDNKNNSGVSTTKEIESPIAIEDMTAEEFNQTMENAIYSYEAGKHIPFERFDKEIRKELDIK